MKLKFRADPKDWMIFGIFSFFWLIVVSLAVANVYAFMNEENFTINFFLAFTTKTKFLITLLLFFAGIAVAFAGVKSYFFDREEGIGISAAPKKTNGYSRWCKNKEMKKALDIVVIKPTDDNISKGGIPLYNDGNEVWVDTGGYHNMIIGSTGSGKSQSISFPFINVMAKAGESMIVTDPKGELYEGTAKELEKRGYNIVLLNFRDPDKGNGWNPFTIPYQLYKSGNKDKAIEMLEDLAKNILYDESSKSDPFWNNTSADYFAGLAWSLFQDATSEDEVNINSINYMATAGEQKLGGTNYIKEYFSSKDPTSTESIKVNSTISAPNETKGSILSVFNQKIQLFSSRETLSSMLSNSDFSMEDIGRKKTAVFIVIQDEKKTYHSLVTIFLKQCYETLVRVAQENNGGKLKYRTNFLLDEFANMPPLSDVDAMVSAARSRNIRLSFIIQNFSQLNDVYGKEKAETIRGNCGNTIYLLSTELNALEEISKMCGEIKSKKDDKTDSRPLVTVTDLQNFKEEEALILRSRMRPFKTKLKFYWKTEWGFSKEKAPYPNVELKPVSIFDLKGFVEKKREEKINNMLGSNGGDKPFGMPFGGGPMGGSPFGSGNPFGGGSPFGSGNPFGGGNPFEPKNIMGSSDNKLDNGFNVDDLVKRIDAKIAELEEEERLENEENNKNNDNSKLEIKDDDNIKDAVIESNNKSDITDDQFFDDFFNDD